MSTRGTSLPRNPDWRVSAACLDGDPDDMFPDPSDARGVEYAKSFCRGCPVRDECLDNAMAQEGDLKKESRFGIRGGLTPGQRYYLRSSSRPPANDEPKPRPKRRSTRPLSPCGTDGAYDRHARLGEPIDDACREAHNARRRADRARKKAAAA